MIDNWQVALTILFLLLGASSVIVAFRLNISLDWNKRQQLRNSEREKRLQSICPHAYKNTSPEGFYDIAPHFSKFVDEGSSNPVFKCDRCGYSTTSPKYIQDLCFQWHLDIDEFDQNYSFLKKR